MSVFSCSAGRPLLPPVPVSVGCLLLSLCTRIEPSLLSPAPRITHKPHLARSAGHRRRMLWLGLQPASVSLASLLDSEPRDKLVGIWSLMEPLTVCKFPVFDSFTQFLLFVLETHSSLPGSETFKTRILINAADVSISHLLNLLCINIHTHHCWCSACLYSFYYLATSSCLVSIVLICSFLYFVLLKWELITSSKGLQMKISLLVHVQECLLMFTVTANEWINEVLSSAW